MQCPDCGVEARTLIEGSCPRCFLGRHPLAEVPLVLDVLLCATCGARRDGQHWTDAKGRGQDAMLDEFVANHVKVHEKIESPELDLVPTEQDERNIHYDVMVAGELGELPVDALVETVLRIKPSVCTTCSRQAGGYYSAIIQFRGDNREPAKPEIEEAERIMVREIDRMVKAGNQNAFITKDGVVKGGKDYYISEIEVGRIMARKLADKFDTTVQESPKLVGRKDGKDVYRVTMLLRLPPYRRGDFVKHRDTVHKVERIEKKTVTLRDLVRHRTHTVPRDQVPATALVAKKHDAKEMQVVSVVRNEALVLDPQTNATHEVVLPDDLEYEMSMRSLDVVEHEEQVYYVGLPEERGRLRLL